MTDFAEGDLVEAVKGETVVRGRVQGINKGANWVTIESVGCAFPTNHAWTLTVIEKALPLLPTIPGWYFDVDNSIWLITENGRRVGPEGVDPVDAWSFAPFARLAPVAEVLAVFAEKANWIPTAAAIQDTAKHFGVSL